MFSREPTLGNLWISIPPSYFFRRTILTFAWDVICLWMRTASGKYSLDGCDNLRLSFSVSSCIPDSRKTVHNTYGLHFHNLGLTRLRSFVDLSIRSIEAAALGLGELSFLRVILSSRGVLIIYEKILMFLPQPPTPVRITFPHGTIFSV